MHIVPIQRRLPNVQPGTHVGRQQVKDSLPMAFYETGAEPVLDRPTALRLRFGRLPKDGGRREG